MDKALVPTNLPPALQRVTIDRPQVSPQYYTYCS
jgi:hypothetical protein